MTDLLQFGANIRSQYGEDGIIAEIFRRIGEGSRWCVELGALNGTHDSNTYALMERGWSGVLIEADLTYFEKLQRLYAQNPRAHCLNSFVSFEGPDSLDALFARTPLPAEFDLFSLDVDGAEYHLWDSLTRYRPRVLVIEFNPTIPPEVDFVQPRDMTVFQGSSLRALVRLGKEKGYELVAANLTNAFFVRREEYAKCDISDNRPEALWRDTSRQTKLFQLYDGTLMISGFDRFLFHKEKIDLRCASKSGYPAAISSSPLVRTLKYAARRLPVYALVQRVRKSLWK